MEIRDLVFKIKRNLIPAARGTARCFSSLFCSGVSFGKGARIGKGSELAFHPGCKCKIGKGLNCGRFSTISVLSKGNLEIGKGVGIGNCNQIVCHNHIAIDDGTLFGPNVMVYDHNHQYSFETGVNRRAYDVSEVVIGKNCWIGAGSVILKGVHIGDNCIIGAGSVVTEDIPAYSMAVGSPAKIIKTKQDNGL